MQAIDLLMDEHDVIMQVLGALECMAEQAEAGAGVDAGHGRMAVEVFRHFVDGCHHSKEEQQLFPALIPHGLTADQGPVAVMLHEHQQGRQQVRELEMALSAVEGSEKQAAARFALAARSYIRLLRDHIAKENQVLFPLAAQMLSEEEGAELLAAFDKVEHEDMGPGMHEKYLDLADELARHYGVALAPRHPGGCGCGHAAGD
jgi:hemerythrin-like domain-containing protein